MEEGEESRNGIQNLTNFVDGKITRNLREVETLCLKNEEGKQHRYHR